jgi:uncharacterized protein YbbK (DUF523 family)
MKKKVIVSACLLGHYCRYDGKIQIFEKISELLSDCEIIPFCPEDRIFGTPRERISIVEIDTEEKILTDFTNQDVTMLLEKQIEAFIKLHPYADAIILKSKSPSCGLGTTPIVSEKKELLRYGDGIAAKMFQEHYKSTKIVDENSFERTI